LKGENDDNLLDVPNLAGNGKLVPQITPYGVEWKNVENKPLFGAPINVFGTPKNRLFDDKKESIPPFIFDGHTLS